MTNAISQSKSKVIKRKIYDPLLIVLHWGISGSCVGLLATGFLFDSREWGQERSHLIFWHAKLGYLLLFFLVTRFIWAMIGPRFARWSDLYHRIKSLISNSHKTLANQSFGHDPKASLVYLLVWLLLLGNVVTGLIWNAIDHNRGYLAIWIFDKTELLHQIAFLHITGAWLIIGFLVIHVGALSWHQVQNKHPMFQAMISGHQFRRFYEK